MTAAEEATDEASEETAEEVVEEATADEVSEEATDKVCPICSASNPAGATTCESCGFTF